MQGSNTTFSVALFGFSDSERRAIARAFTLSATRNPVFSIAEAVSDRCPDILMADAEDTEAVTAWKVFHEAIQGGKEAPTVMASRRPAVDPPHFHIRKPFIATRLLVALEAVATEALGFSPVLAIDPRDDLASSNDIQPVPNRHGMSEAQTSCTALVVDDSLPVRVQMDLALRPFASRVDFAETGERAFELIGENVYDIVFLDVILPGADGYEICKAIKANPETKHTPVIMLTSNSSPADRIKGKLAGCDTYLIKPVRHDVFMEVVDRYFNLPARTASQSVAEARG